jgi:chromate transporter
MADASVSLNRAEPVPLRALFAGFLKVSLCAIGGGGGIVWARRLAVEQRRWIDDRDFADVLSLCQFLPGPNIVGIAVCVGAKMRGGRGALAALAGFTLIPWALGFALGTLLLENARIALLQNILGGISAAAAGLLLATGLRLLRPQRGRPLGLGFAALACAGVALTKLPLLLVLLGLTPASIAAAAITAGRR